MPSVNEIQDQLKTIELKCITDAITNLRENRLDDEAAALETLIPLISSEDFEPRLIQQHITKMRERHAAKPALISVLDYYEKGLRPVLVSIMQAMPSETQLAALKQLEKDQLSLQKTVSAQIKKVGNLPLTNINAVIAAADDMKLLQYSRHQPAVTELREKIISLNIAIQAKSAQLGSSQNEIDLSKVITPASALDGDSLKLAKDELQTYNEKLAQQIEAIQHLVLESQVLQQSASVLAEETTKVNGDLECVTKHNQETLDAKLPSLSEQYFTSTLNEHKKLLERRATLVLSSLLPNEEQAISTIKGLSVNTSEAELRALFQSIKQDSINVYNNKLNQIKNGLTQVSTAVQTCQENIQETVKQDAVKLRDAYLADSQYYNPASKPTIKTIVDITSLGNQITTYQKQLEARQVAVKEALESYNQREAKLAIDAKVGELFNQLCKQNQLNMHKIHHVLLPNFNDEVKVALVNANITELNDEARKIFQKTYTRFVAVSEIVHAVGMYNAHLKQHRHYDTEAKKASAPGFSLPAVGKKVTLAHKIKANEDLYDNFITALETKGSVHAIQTIATELKQPQVQHTLRAHRDNFGTRLIKAITFVVRAVDACLFGRGGVTFYKPNSQVLVERLEKKIETYNQPARQF